MGKKLTTAMCRSRARQYADKCQWKKALEYYDKAIRNYPKTVGVLAQADLSNLKGERRNIANFIKTQK